MSGLRLALEASTREPSIAIGGGGTPGFEAGGDGEPLGAAHASDLMSAVARGVEACGGRPSDLETVMVGVGPGSYTGLRVAVATALGLARSTDSDLLAVPSGEVVAWGSLEIGEECTVLFDIRARHVACARYRREEGEVLVLRAPEAIPSTELEEVLAVGGRLFTDAGSARSLKLEGRAELKSPQARDLLDWGSRRLERDGPTPIDGVRPLYLRPFEAATRRR